MKYFKIAEFNLDCAMRCALNEHLIDNKEDDNILYEWSDSNRFWIFDILIHTITFYNVLIILIFLNINFK